MASASCDKLHQPKSLQLLVCDVKYPSGNYLIHQFVLNNCNKPSDSRSEGFIRYALRSFPSDTVNAKRIEDGFTALHLAVMNRNYFMVKMLLSCLPTVDVNATCGNGKERTSLHLVADGMIDCQIDKATKEEYDLEIVKVLLEYGADVDALDYLNYTALHDAVIMNQTDILELLISKGAAVNTENKKGSTPLHEAVKYCNLEIVKVLLEMGANVEAKDRMGNTALHQAAMHFDESDIFELLISKGANVNAKNGSGSTPLHKAARHGSLEAINVLVEFGADLEAVDDYDGNTALHVAAIHNRIDSLKLLISKGMDVNLKNYDGFTPMYLAIQCESFDILKVLVESGAAVQAQDKDGGTALRIAEKLGNTEIVEYLNCLFANVNLVDRNDRILVSKGVCMNATKSGQQPVKKIRRN